MQDLQRFKATYPIGTVRQLTGLSERQIRYYEETELVVPERTPGGQRRYSQAHVEALLRIKALLAENRDIESIRHELNKRPPELVDILTDVDTVSATRDVKHRFQLATPYELRKATAERSGSSYRERPPGEHARAARSVYPFRGQALIRQRDKERIEE
ncbi:MAG: MerR family transcriptional regulator [Bacillota bacterium]